jgi:nucleotide-binding universal stress UspA family protein
LSADLTILKDPNLLLLTAALVLIASIGKFGGAFIGGTLGGLNRKESFALASGMNARGSTEVIIATIGLSMGVLSQNLFSIIVTMAILTTMAMPPMLRAALARLPLGRDEKVRLEREEIEEKGFVANLERLLLAVDESANAKFASHIAGLLAGARGLPITVLHIGSRAKHQEKKREDEQSHESTVKNAAKAIAELDEEATRDVDVTTRAREKKAGAAVVDEARKGFDLLLVGMDKVLGVRDGFDKKLEDVTAGFEGPLAIVVAKGSHLKLPASDALKILVPVSGSGVSRRGAEIAIALARPNATSLRVMYVSTTRDQGVRRNGASVSLAREEAILKDTGALAARYGVDVTTTLQASTAPEDAILQEIKSRGADLVVMGVDRIQGDNLNFGGVAAAVLRKSKVSVLLVATGRGENQNASSRLGSE